MRESVSRPHVIMTIALGPGVGNHVVSMGFFKAVQKLEKQAQFIAPFLPGKELATYEKEVSEKGLEPLLDKVYEQLNLCKGKGPIILEGICHELGHQSAAFINAAMAKAFRAHVVFISCPTLQQSGLLDYHMKLSYELYLRGSRANLLGVIINRWGFDGGSFRPDKQKPETLEKSDVLAVLPWEQDLFSFSVSALQKALEVKPFFDVGLEKEPISSFQYVFSGKGPFAPGKAGLVFLVSAKNKDAAGALLKECEARTCTPFVLVTDFTEQGFKQWLEPFKKVSHLMVTEKDEQVAIAAFSTLVLFPPLEEDEPRLLKKTEHLARFIDVSRLLGQWQKAQVNEDVSALTPTQFCYYLKEKAKRIKRRIALPESGDERVLKAALILKQEGMVEPVLIGEVDEINGRCKELGLEPFDKVDVLSQKEHVPELIEPLIELRKHKGMDKKKAVAMLESPVASAIMMLKMGQVDGVVAGAATSTADTIRPAFQLIKTKEKGGQVSSLFFICFDQRTVIFADCAVSVDPSSEELAEIAIKSAKTAELFGFDPKVALLSYSSLDSGKGVSVEKVQRALEIVKKSEPELKVDGPLQFDAAFDKTVAKIKAGDSLVAGKANVYIFPDLDAGNLAYKAATKPAGVLSIGPMLQGLNQPVNDLSRGASVEDIVYTALITAINCK
jgi:phosphate acetyltransferase